MREHQIKLPVLAALAVTRGMIGFGMALLVGQRFSTKQRRILGLALVAVGVASTIPLGLTIFRGRKQPETANGSHYYDPPRGFETDVATHIAD
jgi:hypothetical protein